MIILMGGKLINTPRAYGMQTIIMICLFCTEFLMRTHAIPDLIFGRVRMLESCGEWMRIYLFLLGDHVLYVVYYDRWIKLLSNYLFIIKLTVSYLELMKIYYQLLLNN